MYIFYCSEREKITSKLYSLQPLLDPNRRSEWHRYMMWPLFFYLFLFVVLLVVNRHSLNTTKRRSNYDFCVHDGTVIIQLWMKFLFWKRHSSGAAIVQSSLPSRGASAFLLFSYISIDPLFASSRKNERVHTETGGNNESREQTI